MKYVWAVLVMAILFTGCAGRGTKVSAVHKHEQKHAAVTTVLPMASRMPSPYPWDMREEFTTLLREQLGAAKNIKLASEAQANQGYEQVQSANLFGSDLSFVKQFAPSDFVVVTELIEHKTVPYEPYKIKPLYATTGQISDVLTILVRVRVIDMRQATPKVILQEIVPSNHQIARHTRDIDYSVLPWGTNAYRSTPVAIAHSRLARDVAERIKEYIAKSQG
jgi:hypothetical protein